MDFDITQFATPGFIIFCLAIYAVSFSLRKILEVAFSKWNLAGRYFWREAALVALPVLVGLVIGAFLKTFPYPEGFTGRGSHMLYGLVCGLSSSLVYRVVTSLVRKLWPGATPSTPADGSPSP